MASATTLDSLLEAFGGVAIALAATVCSALSQARGSPTAVVTLIACAFVLAPFACFAAVIVGTGLLCCLPILLVGLLCLSVPSMVRQARTALSRLRRACAFVGEFAKESPLLVTGAGLLALPMLPVVLVRRPTSPPLPSPSLCSAVLFSLAPGDPHVSPYSLRIPCQHPPTHLLHLHLPPLVPADPHVPCYTRAI